MKAYTYLTAVLGIVFIICFDSCERYNCIEGNGIYASEDRPTGNFSGVEIDGSFDVFINPDTVTSVVVEGDDNLMRFISTSVRGNVLEIRNTNRRCLNSVNNIVITVSTPSIHYMSIDGSGFISCGYYNTSTMDLEIEGSGIIHADFDCYDLSANIDGSGDIRLISSCTEAYLGIDGSGNINADITCDRLNAEIDGSGEIRLIGSCDDSYMNIDGSGRIRAFDFESEFCYVDIDGSGDVYVFVWDLLDVDVEGTGIVYYEGNPVVRTNDWNKVRRR